MIRTNVKVEERDLGMEDHLRRLQAEAAAVDIGIHPDEEETLIVIAAANEFGATIRHPGGTAYGFATEADAKRGRVRFLKSGNGYHVLGVTGPHIIEIPARSYIRTTVDEQAEKYAQASEGLTRQLIDGNIDKFRLLSIMGQMIEADIKKKMTDRRDPPNAPSTIRRKGSSNPLIDTGLLRSSIRFVVKSKDEIEA